MLIQRQVDILLKVGADRRVHDYNGKSALDYAHQQRSAIMINRLLTSDDPYPVSAQERMTAHRGFGTKVWIDALCISQDDIAERSATVMAMDQIYSHAKCVTVWLGREDMFGKLAIQCLSKLWFPAAGNRLAQSDILPYQKNSIEAYKKAQIPQISDKEWIALAALYLRQNFRRLWCLQEMVLAKDVVM